MPRVRTALTRGVVTVLGTPVLLLAPIVFVLIVWLVLIAIGQAKLGELVAALPGVRVERGRVVVDDDGFTGRAKVFAGGDCANGGKEVVNASAEGKRAARAIHRMMTEQS